MKAFSFGKYINWWSIRQKPVCELTGRILYKNCHSWVPPLKACTSGPVCSVRSLGTSLVASGCIYSCLLWIMVSFFHWQSWFSNDRTHFRPCGRSFALSMVIKEMVAPNGHSRSFLLGLGKPGLRNWSRTGCVQELESFGQMLHSQLQISGDFRGRHWSVRFGAFILSLPLTLPWSYLL